MLDEQYLTSEIYCNPVGDFLGTCVDDVQAILVVIFCLWSVFWGIPLVLRHVGCRRIVFSRGTGCFGASYVDEEKGEAGYTDAETTPAPRPPSKLRKPRPSRPPSPAPPRMSPQNTRNNIRVDDYIAVKSRLAHFRFPAPAVPATPRMPNKPLPFIPAVDSLVTLEAVMANYDSSTPMLLDWDYVPLPPALPDSPTIPPTLFACSGGEAGLDSTGIF